MAEKVVSPGVFTREKDLSFIAQGVATIGATVIGPTQKGPALVPITVEGINQFYAKFGYSSQNTYVPRTVESYTQNSTLVNVVRVLGGENMSTSVWAINSTGSGVTTGTVGVLAATYGNSVSTLSISSSANGVFVVNDGATSYSCSLNSTSPNYFAKVFGTDPQGSKKVFLLYHNKSLSSQSYNQSTTNSTAVGGAVATLTTATGFSHGVTPWIQSQTISLSKYDLFRFHNIGDGVISNKEVKIGIQDIKPGTLASNYYGSFTVVVRAVNGTFGSQDLDRRAEVLETFSNLSLDPTSTNFIAKRIGDRYTMNKVVDGLNRVVSSGSFANNSTYVRVEIASTDGGASNSLDGVPAEAVPYGFKALLQPVPSGLSVYPAAKMVTTQSIDGVYDSRRFFGFDYEWDDNYNYLSFLPSSTTVGNNVSFSLDDVSVPANLTGAPYYGILTNVTGSVANRKFMVPFQGGFDGMSVTQSINTGESITGTNVFGFNCAGGSSTGALQYKKALDAVANAEEVDTNLILLPGIIYSLHPDVAKYAKNVCETRGDCMYIMDGFQINDTVLSAINVLESSPGELDSNYVAVYHPWVKVIESSTGNQMWVPPSVVMSGVYSFNDRVAYEWFAPAGLNRGGISEAIDVRMKLNQSERDDLYEARINPIASFPSQGISAWGQKTLQIRPSALDRVNVRRLLINLKKFVASTSRYLVFEQNTIATRNRFLNLVNPYLSSVQQKQGLYAFKVVMDDTNNTPDIIDRNILYGQIYLKPTKTAEYIIVDFNILPTGGIFPNA